MVPMATQSNDYYQAEILAGIFFLYEKKMFPFIEQEKVSNLTHLKFDKIQTYFYTLLCIYYAWKVYFIALINYTFILDKNIIS